MPLIPLKAVFAEAALVQPRPAPGADWVLASAGVDGWGAGGVAAPALQLLLFRGNLAVQLLSPFHRFVRVGSIWE